MPNKQSGLIGIIILIIIALAFLKYFFNWSIFEALSTPKGKETAEYIHHVVEVLWSYLSVPFMFIWEKLFKPFIELLFDLVLDGFRNFLNNAATTTTP